MKTYLECYSCLLKQSLKLSKMINCSAAQQKHILTETLNFLIKCNIDLPAPLIFEQIEKIVLKYSKNKDIYKELKKKSNDEALELYDLLKNRITNSSSKLVTALKLSAFGNMIDFAIIDNLNLADEFKKFDYLYLNSQHIEILAEKLENSNVLLIIGDNAGEIVFDKILIEFLKSEYPKLKIYYAVRAAAVLNDATLEDAKHIKLNQLCKVLTTGVAIAGIDLNRCSNEFLKLFNNADLIISKGQGNYETLSTKIDARIFYLLKVKCEVVAKHLGVEIGRIILTQVV